MTPNPRASVPTELVDPTESTRRPQRFGLTVDTSEGESDSEGNWLVSYADLMTLLFGFFVMYAAFSNPNSEQIEKVKRATARATHTKYSDPYESLSKSLGNLLADFKLQNEITLTETAAGLVLVSQGTLFFDSASTALRPGALQLIQKIATTLVAEAHDFEIIVEGHTDDKPIHSNVFPSNWELSASRAGTVVRLLEQAGYPRQDLRPIGFADTVPVVPNQGADGKALPDNQARNRRIVLRIQKKVGNASDKQIPMENFTPPPASK